VLTAEHAQKEAQALRAAFRLKRDKMLDGLRSMGVRFEREPDGTFYAWGNLSGLPEGLRTGPELFRAALEKKVIVVPGQFFDVDPGQRRMGRPSRFGSYARFSFGPSADVIERAVERLKQVVAARR
jgi:aspartate/methionine/tyrosine aminotransferase